jgi:hypothetical protein
MKMEGEATRVAPSRARAAAKKSNLKQTGLKPPRAKKSTAKQPRIKAPLVVVANSSDKEAALAGLERWKRKYPKAAELLAPADVLVDSMRGRSSTWTRIRVNLKNVPEDLRPPQETPDPDDDPTREFRAAKKRQK